MSGDPSNAVPDEIADERLVRSPERLVRIIQLPVLGRLDKGTRVRADKFGGEGSGNEMIVQMS